MNTWDIRNEYLEFCIRIKQTILVNYHLLWKESSEIEKILFYRARELFGQNV